jgi:hypothetical protein
MGFSGRSRPRRRRGLSDTRVFTFGQGFSFQATLTSHTVGRFDHQALVDATHSAYWAGFEAVLDGNGNAVAYTLSTGSGTDWSQSFVPSSVPEPGTATSWLVGLAILTVGSLRNQRSLNLTRGHNDFVQPTAGPPARLADRERG